MKSRLGTIPGPMADNRHQLPLRVRGRGKANGAKRQFGGTQPLGAQMWECPGQGELLEGKEESATSGTVSQPGGDMSPN